MDEDLDRAALLRMFPDWARPTIDEPDSAADRVRGSAPVIMHGTELPASWHQMQGSGRHWTTASGEISP